MEPPQAPACRRAPELSHTPSPHAYHTPRLPPIHVCRLSAAVPCPQGKLSRLEFRKACLQMKLVGGAAGESAALDALFTSMDIDGGGDLSLSELTNALRTSLKSETTRATDRVKGTKAAVVRAHPRLDPATIL